MPASFEAAWLLVLLVAPGYIAARTASQIIPYRRPTPFQESLQSLILGLIISPAWLPLVGPFARLRASVDTALSHGPIDMPGWDAVKLFGGVLIVGLLVAPAIGYVAAWLDLARPHVRLGGRIVGWFGYWTVANVRSELGADVWDNELRGRQTTPWARVVFSDGTSVQGLVGRASVAPSPRELLLVGDAAVPGSLVRLDRQSQVIEDLSGNATGVWISINESVREVVFY